MTGKISREDAQRMAASIMLGIRDSLHLSSLEETQHERVEASDSENLEKEGEISNTVEDEDQYTFFTKRNTDSNTVQPTNRHEHRRNIDADDNENEEEVGLKGEISHKCPTCHHEINFDSNWCWECGTAIIRRDPARVNGTCDKSRIGILSSTSNRATSADHNLPSDLINKTTEACASTERLPSVPINTDNDELDEITSMFPSASSVVPDLEETPAEDMELNQKQKYTVKAFMDLHNRKHNKKLEPQEQREQQKQLPPPQRDQRKLLPQGQPEQQKHLTQQLPGWDLPEELIVKVFSFLTHSDRSSCARVCHQFNRIVSDTSLWRHVVLHNTAIDDTMLCGMARKRATSVTITKCTTHEASEQGFHYLFYMCKETLTSLDFSNTDLDGGRPDRGFKILSTLLQCRHIRHFDLSWTNLTDSGVSLVCCVSLSLVSLCVNGCKEITDSSICYIVAKHYDSLEKLELFGCFRVTAGAIKLVISKCRQVTSLNLGQCYQVTDSTICSIALHLPNLHTLDVRGCKKVGDQLLKCVVQQCCQLRSLDVANCPLVTDTTLNALTRSTSVKQLTTLDISGVEQISEWCIQKFITECVSLKRLDVSSTKATQRSIFTISTSQCTETLESLKLNFCRDITQQCLLALVSNCRRLRVLFLYGCGVLRCRERLLVANSRLDVRCDSAVKNVKT